MQSAQTAAQMLAVDPLLEGDISWSVIFTVLLKVVIAFAGLLIAVMLMVWWERKLISDMQNRIGPNKAGPFGLLQTLADGIKLFFKEDLIPDKADKFVFKLAPLLSVVPAFLTFAIIPISGNFGTGKGTVTLFNKETFVAVADPHIGILFVLAMSSLAVYGVMLAGWSSGSKYPLLGSVRASAQMVSYEAALGLAIASVLLQSKSLSVTDIVKEQSMWNWNIALTGVVPFLVFMVAGTAELNRPPFDLVEAEQELVGGFHTEYSSIKFAMFFLAEFMNTVTMSAIIVTLFLGGPSGPNFGTTGLIRDAVLPFIWFFGKLFVFIFVFVWFRATLPRFRYDQLMDVGWKFLIPIALGWFLVLTAINLSDVNDWNKVAVVAGCIGALGLGWLLLSRARTTAIRRRELAEVK